MKIFSNINVCSSIKKLAYIFLLIVQSPLVIRNGIFIPFVSPPPKHSIYRCLARVCMETVSHRISVSRLERTSVAVWFNSALGSLCCFRTSITTFINLHENWSPRQIPVQSQVPLHVILASLLLKRLFPK